MSAFAPVAGSRPVLADVFPRTLARDVAFVLGAALLTAAASQLRIPLGFSPVPITGGTFAVLLTAAALGPARAAAGQATYLLLGAVGLPVFSGWTGGVSYLVGPSGGYLVGFVVAATVVGACARRGWDRGPLGMAATFALGSLVIYALGVPWLAFVGGYGVVEALGLGVAPFLVGDALKAVAAALALPAAWRLAGDRA
ncbi:MAG TPA: biotin transporter BioY [Egibacteraceae bacterium]|nr:biotin transporter BioY [Egibacteraceae bacterium]